MFHPSFPQADFSSAFSGFHHQPPAPSPLRTALYPPQPPPQTTPWQQPPSSPLSSASEEEALGPPRGPSLEPSLLASRWQQETPPGEHVSLLPRRTESPSSSPTLPMPPRSRFTTTPGQFFSSPSSSTSPRGPVRPNPLLLNRQDAQEKRRNRFWQSHARRNDDWRWERRDVEQKLQSAEWFNQNTDFRRALESDAAGFMTATDIADAEEGARLQQEAAEAEAEGGSENKKHWGSASMMHTTDENMDDMMADAMLQEEEAEIDALIASSSAQEEQQQQQQPLSVDASSWSDDEDYDALFTDLISGHDDDHGLGELVSSGDVVMG